MTEIYWITRLDLIVVLSAFVVLICTLVGIGYVLVSDGSITDSISRIKWMIVTDVIALLILVFVPTSKDALMIYGLGSVKEYVESNNKVKELPDKAIEVLDKYLDNINKDVNKNSNN